MDSSLRSKPSGHVCPATRGHRDQRGTTTHLRPEASPKRASEHSDGVGRRNIAEAGTDSLAAMGTACPQCSCFGLVSVAISSAETRAPRNAPMDQRCPQRWQRAESPAVAVSMASQAMQRRPWSISSTRLRARARRLDHTTPKTTATITEKLSSITNTTGRRVGGWRLEHKGKLPAHAPTPP